MTWKRPQVFNLWAFCIKRLIRDFPEIEFVVTVAGSEGSRSKRRVEKHGFNYIEAPNHPIGRKANTRLQYTKTFKPDYVLFLGDDDLLTSSLFQYYLDRIKEGYDEIAPLDIYYYVSWLDKVAYSKGYIDHRKGEPVAVGRMLSKRALNKVKWTLWADHEDKYLDNHIIANLKHQRIKRHYFRVESVDGMLLDVKTDTNMTQFKWRKNYEEKPLFFLDEFEEKDEILCVG